MEDTFKSELVKEMKFGKFHEAGIGSEIENILKYIDSIHVAKSVV